MKNKTIIFAITLLTICITGCGKKYDESPLSLIEGYNAIISEAKADGREVYPAISERT